MSQSPEPPPADAPADEPTGPERRPQGGMSPGRVAALQLLGPVFLLWGVLRGMVATSFPDLSPAVADATAGTLGSYVFALWWGPLRGLPGWSRARWWTYLPALLFYGVICGSLQVRRLLELDVGSPRSQLVGLGVGVLCVAGAWGGLVLGTQPGRAAAPSDPAG